MARTNACSELTRFWIEVRHGCLVTANVPVAVPYAQSDIDIVALHPAETTITLPDNTHIGPRLIIETKDEHDWDPRGIEFGKLLRSDISHLGPDGFVPRPTKEKIKFSMLREAHYERATGIFGGSDFDRLFVTHALAEDIRADVSPILVSHRIHWLTIPELMNDLVHWYHEHPRPSGVRFDPVGDLLHLLVGYCGLSLQ